LWNSKGGKVTWDNKAPAGYFYGNKRYMNIVDPQCAATFVAPPANGGRTDPTNALWTACNAQSIFGTGLRALALDTNNNGLYESGTDPIVFQNSPLNRRGNYGMNTLTGPGRWSLDMAMGKSIEFMEGKKIDFRIDAQNIFNHATPSNSSSQSNARFTSIGNPQFALNSSANDFGILSTKGGHRTFQAKIRISF